MSAFDQRVDRNGMSTVKQALTPECVKRSGIMSLWGAEFEFPTADFVVDAVVDWARRGLYAYTVDNEEFRGLICSWMLRQRKWTIEPEWIVPAYGITSSLATAMRTFTKEGDGIIGLDPGYHMYWEAIERSGRRRISSKLLFDGTAYSVDWDDLEAKMSDPCNKILVVCNPHNPIGKVYMEDEIRRIAELAAKTDTVIFNDEIFAECLYSGVEMHTFGQYPQSKAKVITAVSLGKWLSFTGTNQANLLIPDAETRDAFLRERNREFYGSMNPMMLPAYRAAYTEKGAAWVRDMMAYVEENFLLVDSTFRTEIPLFRAVKPQGTFILWVDATEFCSDAEKLERFLNEKAFFHVDPGVQYHGDPGFFRMTLSVPRAELRKALNSLASAVKESGKL